MGAAAFSSGKQRAGKGCRLVILAQNINVKTVNFSDEADDLDTTNFEAVGWENGTPGVRVGKWDFDGDWDAGRNFFDSPPGITPRDDLGVDRNGNGSATQIYPNLADNKPHSIPTSRVLSSKNSLPVRGLVGFSASCKTNGQYTVSTGSV